MLSFSIGLTFSFDTARRVFAFFLRPIILLRPGPDHSSASEAIPSLRDNRALSFETYSTTMVSFKIVRAEGKYTLTLVFCTTAALWICGLALWTTYQNWVISDYEGTSLRVIEPLCKQDRSIIPTKHSDIWNYILSQSKTERHRSEVVDRLGGAVRIPYVRSQF